MIYVYIYNIIIYSICHVDDVIKTKCVYNHIGWHVEYIANIVYIYFILMTKLCGIILLACLFCIQILYNILEYAYSIYNFNIIFTYTICIYISFILCMCIVYSVYFLWKKKWLLKNEISQNKKSLPKYHLNAHNITILQ